MTQDVWFEKYYDNVLCENFFWKTSTIKKLNKYVHLILEKQPRCWAKKPKKKKKKKRGLYGTGPKFTQASPSPRGMDILLGNGILQC